MSEDDQFNEEKPQINKRRCGLDIFGSLGEGMLAKENIETLRNSPGLTPLGFDVRDRFLNKGSVSEGFSITGCLENSSGLTPLDFGVRDRVPNRCSAGEGFSTTGNTEGLKNSPGLTPLRPFGEIHNGNLKTPSLDEGFSAKLDRETVKISSGSPLSPFSETNKRRVIK